MVQHHGVTFTDGEFAHSLPALYFTSCFSDLGMTGTYDTVSHAGLYAKAK